MKLILSSIAVVSLFSFFAHCDAIENENKNKEEVNSFDQLFQPIKERDEIQKKHGTFYDIKEVIMEREQNAKKIMDDRAKLISTLIFDVKIEEPPVRKEEGLSKFFHSEKHVAIILLGGLRAVEAIDVLIENIAYSVSPSFPDAWTARNTEEYFPAAVALIRIGSPAIPAVLDKLYFTDDEGTRKICTWILVEMLGKGLAKAQLDFSIASFDRFINNARKPGDFADDVIIKLNKLSKEQLIEIKTRLESLENLIYFDIRYNPRILNRRDINKEIISIFSNTPKKELDGKLIKEK